MIPNLSLRSANAGNRPSYQQLKSEMLAAGERVRAARPAPQPPRGLHFSTPPPSPFSPDPTHFAPPPFPIAGFRYYDGAAALPELQPGTPLTLRPEPDNVHDPCAVAILHRGRKLGYIPRFLNRQLSRLLQDEVAITCKVARISADAPPWDAVAVRVSVPQTELLAA